MKRSRFDIALQRYPSIKKDQRENCLSTAYPPSLPLPLGSERLRAPTVTDSISPPVFKDAFGLRTIEIQTGDEIHFTGGYWWYTIMIRQVWVEGGRCSIRFQAFDSKNKKKRGTITTAREFVPKIQPLFNSKIAKVGRNGVIVFESYPY